jgi:hypothetical protein
MWPVVGAVVALWYLSEHYFAPIYGIFLRGTSSFAEIADRIEVVAKSPGILASILYYDLLMPLVCLWVLAFAVLAFVPGRGAYVSPP